MSADIILVIVIATALAFHFTNGFHDTADVVAPAISTRAIAPKPAVAMAALLNFVGAFLSLKVAATVGKRLCRYRRDHDDRHVRRAGRGDRMKRDHPGISGCPPAPRTL